MANLLDIFFPKFCVNCKKMGDYLCPNCFTYLSYEVSNICLVCIKPSYDGLIHPKCHKKNSVEGSFTGLVFNKTAKKLVYKLKYKPYIFDLASFLGDLLYESLIQKEEFNKILKPFGLAQGGQVQDDIVLVPIPLSSKKFKKRGYNQAEILAKELAKKFDLKVCNYLIRVKETKSQVGLNKKERKENLKGAFELNIRYSANFKDKRVILVDDILTTGSTFSEAAKVIKNNGAREVWAVAFAKED
jgi:competence protein ComFC